MIRPFGLRDIPGMRRLVARGSAFDLRKVLLQASSPLYSSLVGLATHHVFGAHSWVWHGKHCTQRGLVQVVSRANHAEWNLVFLAPALAACQESPEIWHDLLGHVIASAARQAIRRVYAYAPQDDEVEATMHGAGFTRVTREEIFYLAQYPTPAASPSGLRRVDGRDAWALDQFYRHVVPPQVQKAEGMRPHWSQGQVAPYEARVTSLSGRTEDRCRAI